MARKPNDVSTLKSFLEWLAGFEAAKQINVSSYELCWDYLFGNLPTTVLKKQVRDKDLLEILEGLRIQVKAFDFKNAAELSGYHQMCLERTLGKLKLADAQETTKAFIVVTGSFKREKFSRALKNRRLKNQISLDGEENAAQKVVLSKLSQIYQNPEKFREDPTCALIQTRRTKPRLPNAKLLSFT